MRELTAQGIPDPPTPPPTPDSPYLLGLPGHRQAVEVVAVTGADAQGSNEGAEDEGVGILWVAWGEPSAPQKGELSAPQRTFPPTISRPSLLPPHLKEAHPMKPFLIPLGGQAAAVEQSVHVAVAMRLGLDLVGVVGLQGQVGVIVSEAGHLFLLDQSDLQGGR